MGVRTPGELGEDQSKVDEGFGMERPSHLPQDTRVDNLLELLRANGSAVMNRLFGPQAAGPDHGMEFSDAFTQEFNAIEIETYLKLVAINRSRYSKN